VVLVGDIERGGVIAQLVGTHSLLSASERPLLSGYIVNKFRGDIGLFDGGIAAITGRTGMGCFGVVPFFPAAAALPAEDSLALTSTLIDAAPTPTLPRLRGREFGRAQSPLYRTAGERAERSAAGDGMGQIR